MQTVQKFDHHIILDPHISGGKPHIAGHRITVQNIAIWHERLGKSPDEIASEYNLPLADIYAALTYYFDHRADIDMDIEASEDFIQSLQEKTPSIFKQKLQEHKPYGTKD
jgi:uncharacterized protein (DUF433 family)